MSKEVSRVRSAGRSVDVVVLDDHPVVLDGLVAYLSGMEDVRVVARSANIAAGLAETLNKRPQLLITDIKMPGGSIFDMLQRLGSELPELKVLIVSGHDEDVIVEKAFAAGVRGFVSKGAALEELGQAISTIMADGFYVSENLSEKLVTGPSTNQAAVATRLAPLTKREREILHYVSLGMSAKEISESLKISTWTVTNHKANIMAKLNIHNQVGLTRFALSTGLTSV